MFYSLLSIYIRNAYVDFGKSEYKTFFSYMSFTGTGAWQNYECQGERYRVFALNSDDA